MNLEQFPRRFVNNRQKAGVAEGASLPAGSEVAPDSEFWAGERTRRTSPVMIVAYGEPDGIMLANTEHRRDSA